MDSGLEFLCLYALRLLERESGRESRKRQRDRRAGEHHVRFNYRQWRSRISWKQYYLDRQCPRGNVLVFHSHGARQLTHIRGRPSQTLIGGSTWQATVGTSSLLGEYEVVPVASNSSGTTTCSNATEVFAVQTSSPAQPGQVPCASMTGTWSDTASGQPTLTWTLNQTSGTGNQTITGTATATAACGQQITWNVTGSYFDAPTYNIYGTGGSPANWTCNGMNYTTLNQYINGSLDGGGSCGLGNGT